MSNTLIFGHGFSADTYICLANDGWQDVRTVCVRSLRKKVLVASYDVRSAMHYDCIVKRGGKSKSNCYIKLIFEKSADKIYCTPEQEFYLKTHCWVQAYELKSGDELICKNGTNNEYDITFLNTRITTNKLQENYDVLKHQGNVFEVMEELVFHDSNDEDKQSKKDTVEVSVCLGSPHL